MEANLTRDVLMREAAIMAQFNHDHVLRLVGVVTVCAIAGALLTAAQVGSPMLILIEYAENGSLDKFLQTHEVTNAQGLQMAIDVCDGLEYLHSKVGTGPAAADRAGLHPPRRRRPQRAADG